MKRKNATRNALFTSIISLLLCVSMLVGTTFAWFTDTVVSADNIIKTGTLDIVLEYLDGDTWKDVKDSSDILSEEKWEPGYVDVAYLRLKNAGTLALKYQLGINIVTETPGVNQQNKTFKLSDYIYFDVIEDVNGEEDAYANRAEALKDATENTKISVGYSKPGTLEAGTDEYVYLALIAHMPTTVGNEANHNGIKPEIDLGIKVFATQVEAELDSFDKNYDNGAYIPAAPEAIPDEGKDLVLKSSDESDVTVKVPAAIVAGLDDKVTALAINASAPIVDTVNNTVKFSTVDLVDQDGNVVDLEALNLGQNITITLPAQDQFAPGATVIIYHDGEYMASATVNADKTISYEAAHLCEVVVGAPEAPEADADGTIKIGTAAELFGFAQKVNSGEDYYQGKTVVLTADIDLTNAEWTPIGSATMDHGFMGNFDGNGKTISNLSIKNIVPDADNYVYAGLFGVTEGEAGAENVIKNLTIKNVTINTDGHIVAAAIAYPYYTTVANITVCGDIAIKGGDYTSGVLAYTRRCTSASNLTVNGNAGSYITGATTVGGVISDIQMNGGLKANYANFSAANVTVTGNKAVGGISGIIGGQTLNGATVKNVTLVCSDAHVGIVAGSFDSKPVINNVKYANVTGATSIAGAPYGTGSNGYVVIDGDEYAGNAATFKEQLATGTVNLACDIALDETITIAGGQNVVINLNGNTISGTMSGTGNQDLFLVKGNLTVNNGSINLTATQNQGWGAMSAIFDITGGGVVNIDNVVADNKGGTDMNFVAHLNNWGSATLNVTNSTLKATYVAVRVFNSGNDMNNVSIKDSTLTTTGNAAFWVHNYTAADFGTQEKADAQAKLLNFTFENVKFEAKKAAFRYGFTNAEYRTPEGVQIVSTANDLVAALEAGKNVVMNNDIKIDPANMSNAYGKTGINVKNGQTIDGNGYVLDIKGAGGTWDSGINTTGGAIKNIKVTGAFRGVFVNHTSTHSEKVVLENVIIDGTTYTISCDQGMNQNLEAYNSTFNGWTSYATTIGEVKFVDCSFGEGNGYAYCRPYAPTEFVGCDFEAGFAVDPCAVITFENCTINGEPLTAENLSDLVQPYYGNASNASVK